MEVRPHSDSESKTISSRRTRDSRRITYILSVLQQPERARACGQGAKAQTDRRPVDPPPIIDLTIWEGEEGQERDITQTYSPSFFLWASLEHARPHAHGRVPQSAITNPILTGQIVAGASLLERPNMANYFIFPDLSVRHEGHYRLSFNLYEHADDDDVPRPSGPQQQSNQGFQICRSSVKSEAFQVYSAKKFPGLNESTHLSRVVADQGCRVRIRRDVRMRKRDAKDAKDWEDYEEKTAEQRAKVSATPELHHAQTPATAPPSADAMGRARSLSATSNVSYHPMVEHRKSASDLSQQYHHHQPYAPPPPAPPTHSYTYPQPSAFDQHSHSQYAAPHYAHQSPIVAHSPQQPPTLHGSPYHYHQQHSIPPNPGYGYIHHQQPPPPSPYEQPQSPYAPLPPAPNGTYNHLSQPSPLGPQEHSYIRQLNLPPPPTTYPTPSSFPPAPYPPQPLTAPPSGRMTGKALPPLTTSDPLPPSTTTSTSTPATSAPPTMHRNSSCSYVEPTARPLPPHFLSQQPSSAPAQKRSYGEVFNTTYMGQPLRQGARPVPDPPRPFVHPNAIAADSDEEEDNFDPASMMYRRADGSIRYWTSPRM